MISEEELNFLNKVGSIVINEETLKALIHYKYIISEKNGYAIDLFRDHRNRHNVVPKDGYDNCLFTATCELQLTNGNSYSDSDSDSDRQQHFRKGEFVYMELKKEFINELRLVTL